MIFDRMIDDDDGERSVGWALRHNRKDKTGSPTTHFGRAGKTSYPWIGSQDGLGRSGVEVKRKVGRARRALGKGRIAFLKSHGSNDELLVAVAQLCVELHDAVVLLLDGEVEGANVALSGHDVFVGAIDALRFLGFQ